MVLGIPQLKKPMGPVELGTSRGTFLFTISVPNGDPSLGMDHDDLTSRPPTLDILGTMTKKIKKN